jgi:hypothetical protein
MIIPLLVGVAGFFYFSSVRAYPFQLALLMGVAGMLLSWAALRTWERLRGMFRE